MAGITGNNDELEGGPGPKADAKDEKLDLILELRAGSAGTPL